MTSKNEVKIERSFAAVALVVLAVAAAVVLIVVGVELLSEINGPECHGEFPVCTTPSQHSVRQSFAAWCAVGVIAFLAAAPYALKARRFNWSHALLLVVIAMALAAVIADPVSHLQREAGSDQWFISSWPL
jgi:lysylphosphatidylglycerol synthetase-like protein (DUF2156 family)